jgi:PBP1b-binding outer membrane lipoprotein LpoB
MKHKTSYVLVLLAFIAVHLTGCQSPESAAQKAQKKVDQEQQRVDQMDKTLSK